MKVLLNIIRIIVGVLFIFSGLVKANDPMGLSYKMQEFFDAWHISQFNNYTLAFALIMNVFEVVAGVAVLIGWRMKLFSWLLLLLIIFFTFLTGYANYSGKFASCGCFGDCIPITPMQSFLKDVLLLVLIIFLFINHKKIQPLFKPRLAGIALGLSIVLISFFQWYVLVYLPVVDCLPYKKGNNLLEQMQMPAGYIPDKYGYVFEYRKDGKSVEFTEETLPEDLDSTYEFVDRKEKLIAKGNGLKANITEFSLTTLSGIDVTNDILQTPAISLMIFVYDFDNTKWINEDFKEIRNIAHSKNIPIYIITPSASIAKKYLAEENILNCDGTVVKTAARVKPTYFLMDGPIITEKLSYANSGKLVNILKTYPTPEKQTEEKLLPMDSSFIKARKYLTDTLIP